MNTNEWQPIETAPRDGKIILIYGEDFGVTEGRCDQGYWLVFWYHTDVNPTHWMPLPEPPK